MPRRYDLLAIDLDGTLLDPAGKVSRANIEALRLARRAGMTVLICTGRGLVECRAILDDIEQTDPVVVAGGSIVADPRTGETIHRFPMDPALVAALVGVFNRHDHAALVLKDPAAAGFDYLVIAREPSHLDPVTRWWFDNLGVKVRHARSLAEDEHPEHTVRVGFCGTSAEAASIADEVDRAVGDRAVFHHFPAVVPEAEEPEDRVGVQAPHPAAYPDRTVVILECFDRDATKWSGIRLIAGRRGIPRERVCAIGDQINDVPMLREAGLAVAMANAVLTVRDLADRTTLSNAHDGVAYAIDQVLRGHW